MPIQPSWDNPMSDLDLIKALNWFHIYSTESKIKRYVRNYIQMFKSSLLPKLKNVNEYVIHEPTYSYLAYLITEGYEIPEIAKDRFVNELEKRIIPTLYSVENATPEKSKKKRKKNMETIVDLGELEHQLDLYIASGCQSNGFSVYKYLQGKKAKQMDATEIKKWYRPLRKELEDALKIGLEHKDVRESYAFLTKPQLKRLVIYVDTMIMDCDKYMKEKRVPRKKNGTSETQASLETNLVGITTK